MSRQRLTTRVNSSDGFSLMEVLIAMFILTLGATSIIALFASASATHKRAVDRTQSALIAEQLFGEIQARYFHDTEPRTILDDLKQSVPTKINGYYWDVILHRPGAAKPSGRSRRSAGDSGWGETELIVRLAIKWADAAEPREEVYTTILLPRVR